MNFKSKEIEFMKSLGLNMDFKNNLTDDELNKIEDIVADKLQISGFDKNYEVTSIGLMCESILDQLS